MGWFQRLSEGLAKHVMSCSSPWIDSSDVHRMKNLLKIWRGRCSLPTLAPASSIV